MRRILGLPLSNATLAVWERRFCFALEPFFLDADLNQRLEPHALTMTRAEWSAWSRSQPLEFVDAYQPWNAGGEFVTLLTPAEFAALTSELRHSLNAAQVALKRGLTFLLEMARGFGVQEEFLERDGTADSFLLRCDAWAALPRTARWDWLCEYVSQDAPLCLSSSLTRPLRTHHRRALRWVGWSPGSGPNCFATALSFLEPNPTRGSSIARLWLQKQGFERELERLGLQEEEFSTDDLQPNRVLVWRDAEGALLHACAYLGDELVLNKDGQSWYNPRQVLSLETVLDRWPEGTNSVSVLCGP